MRLGGLEGYLAQEPHRRGLQQQGLAGDGVLEAQAPGVEPEAV